MALNNPLYHGFMSKAAPIFRKIVANHLEPIGVRAEDLRIRTHPEVAEALELSSAETRTGRWRRLVRAHDLLLKGKRLSDYAPNLQLETYKFELEGTIKKINARDAEIRSMNTYKN